MTPSDRLAGIVDDPRWLAFTLEAATDRLTFLRLAEEDYRKASFLDQRILGPETQRVEAAWADVGQALPPDARRDGQFIFHIGNVGSTLISRLLGELDEVFAVREPLLLRDFADLLDPGAPPRWSRDAATQRIDLLRALLSRTFRPGQRAMVKATSFTSELASRLVPAGSRALFLFASPGQYLANILAGQNSAATLAMLSGIRLQRLQRRCPGLAFDLATATDARKAALGWACEMTCLTDNASQLPSGTVSWVDFDRFLSEPVEQLALIAAHFGLAIEQKKAAALCDGPLMRQYSKALEFPFSPADRAEILAEARWRHGAALADALGWLNQVAERYPAVAEAIRRSHRGADVQGNP